MMLEGVSLGPGTSELRVRNRSRPDKSGLWFKTLKKTTDKPATKAASGRGALVVFYFLESIDAKSGSSDDLCGFSAWLALVRRRYGGW
jgi:hypothetical protein